MAWDSTWVMAEGRASATLALLLTSLGFTVILIIFVYMGILSAYVSVHHSCSWYPWIPEEGIRSFRTGVTGSCEILCGC